MESGDKFSVKTFSDIVNLENKKIEKTPEQLMLNKKKLISDRMS